MVSESMPRLMTNFEVLEVVKERRKLRSRFLEEDRDPSVDMLLATLEGNLLNRKGEVTRLPELRKNVKNGSNNGHNCEITFETLKAFMLRIKEIEETAGLKFLASEKLQLVNLRPDNETVVKLIVPDRDGALLDEHYDMIIDAVRDLLIEKPDTCL